MLVGSPDSASATFLCHDVYLGSFKLEWMIDWFMNLPIKCLRVVVLKLSDFFGEVRATGIKWLY